MSSTFGSLSTALSALTYSRAAMDVASGNIANANTDGYTRRRIEAAATGAPTAPAMWSRYDGHGDGVTVTGVTRMTDELLVARTRTEHAQQSLADVSQSGLQDLESAVSEPSSSGVSAALSDFRSAWHDVVNNPGPGSSARNVVLARAQALAAAISTQTRAVADTMTSQGQRLQSTVGETNSVTAGLADTNTAIAAGKVGGADVSDLLDIRDRLTLRLSELTGATVTLRPDGQADVSLGGVPLVQGPKASTLAIASGVSVSGTPDGSAVTFAVTAPGGLVTSLDTISAGDAGGSVKLLGVTLPAYQQGLDAVARQLADTVNAQHQAGYDAAGNPGTAVFAYDPTSPASSLTVAITDPSLIAASSVPGGGTDAGNADALASAAGVDGLYRQLVTGLGTSVQSAQRAATNQQVLTNQFDNAREQQAGVNIDEETVSMMQNQRAYEAAAKVISTIDSVLDTLINRMLS
ncbi:MAG: flagellar hook-associated protein FlgK [Actinomycetota bacterium]|nr:flagellar hook-associated protein FlgK [Actinomycetota bacterium]